MDSQTDSVLEPLSEPWVRAVGQAVKTAANFSLKELWEVARGEDPSDISVRALGGRSTIIRLDQKLGIDAVFDYLVSIAKDNESRSWDVT